MGQITVEKNVGGIEGLCVITPTVHGDNRGYFMETYSQRDMEEAGIHIDFVQDNQFLLHQGRTERTALPETVSADKACQSHQGQCF